MAAGRPRTLNVGSFRRRMRWPASTQKTRNRAGPRRHSSRIHLQQDCSGQRYVTVCNAGRTCPSPLQPRFPVQARGTGTDRMTDPDELAAFCGHRSANPSSRQRHQPAEGQEQERSGLWNLGDTEPHESCLGPRGGPEAMRCEQLGAAAEVVERDRTPIRPWKTRHGPVIAFIIVRMPLREQMR